MRNRRIEALENINFFASKDVEGAFDIPVIKPVKRLPKLEWKAFNLTRSLAPSENVGVHFFIDDYRFQTVWNNPRIYAEKLTQYGAVLTPDFSTYTDFPIALQVYNHYRKHWCAAYWQHLGAVVIPTISWSDERSFDWCFDGEPHGGIVAVSTVGVRRDKEARRLFRTGFDEMVSRLLPCSILCYGEPFNFMEGLELIVIKPFTNRFEEG